jgi:hypothetical protein
VNREIRVLAEAGCPQVQLDVQTFSTLMSMGALNAAEGAEIISGYFEGIEGVRRGIHICSGNMRGRPLSANLSCAGWWKVPRRFDEGQTALISRVRVGANTGPPTEMSGLFSAIEAYQH